MLGVPCTTTMRDLEAAPPEYQGHGRRPKAPWQSVTEWRQGLPADAWRHLTVRDGEKGPVEIAMVRRRVQTRVERKRIGPEEWLVVTRRPLTDERTWEPRASRDATEPGRPTSLPGFPHADGGMRGGVQGAIAWGTGARHQSERLH